jgi:hypothetical protein
LLREEGRLAAIARRVKRADGSRGVSRSMVSHVLAGRKRSPRVVYAILQEAARLERSRAYRALGRPEQMARRFEIWEQKFQRGERDRFKI